MKLFKLPICLAIPSIIFTLGCHAQNKNNNIKQKHIIENSSCTANTNEVIDKSEFSFKTYTANNFIDLNVVTELDSVKTCPTCLVRELHLEFPTAIKGYKDLDGLHKSIAQFIGNENTKTIKEAIDSYKSYDKNKSYNLIVQPDNPQCKEFPKEKLSYCGYEEETNAVLKSKLNSIIIYKLTTLIKTYKYSIVAFLIREYPNYRYLNYDLKENKVITFSILFKDEKILELCDLINKHFPDGAMLREDTSIENFYLNENSITFSFDVGTAACMAMDTVLSEIPFSEIEPCLTDYGKSLIRIISKK